MGAQKTTDPAILGSLRDALRSGVDMAAGGAIGFSGGVDSSILLYLSEGKLKPYASGFPGSVDIASASEAGELMGNPPTIITLDREYLKKAAAAIRKIDPTITQLEIGYEIVLYSILDNVRQDKVVTGQGSDELFYGYMAFRESPSITNEGHLQKLRTRTLPREEKMAEEFSKVLVTPYLSDAVIQIASETGRDQNIIGNRNKAVLRDLARFIGIPEEICERPKKAAQYGSLVQKELRHVP